MSSKKIILIFVMTALINVIASPVPQNGIPLDNTPQERFLPGLLGGGFGGGGGVGGILGLFSNLLGLVGRPGGYGGYYPPPPFGGYGGGYVYGGAYPLYPYSAGGFGGAPPFFG